MTTVTTTVPHAASGDAPPLPPPLPPRSAAVWRAMLWKECREIGLIAGLILLAVGGVLGYLVVQESNIVTGPYPRGNYLTAGDAFISGAVTIMAPLAALLLGFLQFITESRQDRFGFIVHRPASRTRLFWGKVVAGIGLYLAVFLIPLAMAMSWASNPYNIPLPFTWEMGLPALMDIVAGIPFYLAAILVARRSEARWVGSRLLPAAAPIIAAAANFAAPGVGWGLLASLVAIVVLLPAAQGAYVAGGQYRPMKWPAKTALGITMGVTLCMAGALALSLLDEYFRPVDRRPYTYESLQFDKQGDPVILHQNYNESGLVENWTVTDLRGGLRPKPEVPGRKVSTGDMILSTRQLYYNSSNYRAAVPHSPGSYFMLRGRTLDGTQWYSRAGEGGDYWVGFQRLSRVRVGAIGVNGFEPVVAVPRASFLPPLNGVSYTVSGDKEVHFLISAGDTLYRLTQELKIEPLYQAPETIQQVNFLGVGQESGPDGVITEVFPLVQTDHKAIILSSDAQAKPLVQFTIEQPQRQYLEVGRVPSTGTFLIVKIPLTRLGARHVYYFDTQGKVDHDMELPVLGERWRPQYRTIEYAGMAMLPPVLMNGGTIVEAALRERSDYLDPELAELSRQFLRVGLVLSNGVGLVSALGLFLLGRWRRLPRGATWFWTVLGYLLGPVAILMLLCTRGLPVLGRCGHCGKPGAVADGTCASCGTPRALPERNGTEIFA